MKKLVITFITAILFSPTFAQVEIIESDSKSAFDGNSYEVISDLSLLNGFRVNRTNDGPFFARIKEFTHYPAEGELVAKNTNIELVFNDFIDIANIYDEISITGSLSGVVSYSWSWGPSRRKIILNPINDFLDNEVITINITDQITGTYGRWNPQNITFQFNVDRHTNIPDSNFEQALIDLGYDDELNGYARTSILETITDLNVASKQINLLTGLEAMTNLRTLDASINTIGSVDFSNNILLEDIIISRNQLSGLILPTPSSLTSLNVSDNTLTDLDLSSSLALVNVNIRLNSLECVLIDASQQSASVSWNKDRFSFFTTDCNNISYTYIPDDEFERFLIDNTYDLIQDDSIPTAIVNDIVSLNIDNRGIYLCLDANLNSFPCNYNVADLTGIQDFVSLTSLVTTDADIALADFTNNTNLQYLKLVNTSLSTVDLSNSGSLESVIIESNQGQLALSLPSSGSLKHVNLHRTNTNPLDLSTEILLEHLDVSYSNLTQLTLLNNPNLVTLNAFDCRSLEILQIPNSLSIADLDIRRCYALACVEVAPSLLGNIPASWMAESGTFYSDDCTSKTHIPDDAFEEFLVHSGLDNKLDDYVLNSFIENVEVLNISNSYYNISDLTGIEGFTSLKTLNLFDDNLPTIDLSSNSNLESIRLSNCNTTSINLTGLINLMDIDIQNNPITSLDLTGLQSLQSVDARNNQLTSVVLSGNSLLGTLELSNNLIASLDLLAAPNLGHLSAHTNNLALIDLSANPLLNFVSLANNQLADLNVSFNPALTTLNTQGNQLLSCITVSAAQLSSIPSNWFKDSYTGYSQDCSQRTFIPDNNFEQALIDEGYDNALDDYISTSVAQTIESLSFLNNKAISSLEGIQDFTSLLTLQANGNLITTIDLSNNVLLQVLDLSSNNLSAIDLTGLTQLNGLRLDNNSNLSTVDVQALTGLTVLGVSNTSVAEISISSNPSLVALYASNLSDLIYLDVSNNAFLNNLQLGGGTNLTCVKVNSDQFSNTPVNWQITSGTSDKTFLSLLCEKTIFNDNNFEQEIINTGYDQILDGFAWKEHMPNITFLNINNKGIADISGIEDLTGLQTFWAGNNSFATIDLSNSQSIESIIVSENTLLNSLTVSSSSLKFLNADNTSLSTIDLTASTGLEELYLRNVPLSNLDVSSNTLLERLFLNGSSLNSLDLKVNTEIRYFDSRTSTITCVEVNSQQEVCANGCSGWFWQTDPTTSLTSSCDLVFVPDNNFEQALIDFGLDNTLDDYVIAGNIDHLTFLSLDGNTYSISDYTGLEGFISLETLWIKNSNLTSGIDLTGLPNLKSLDAANSQITSLNSIQFSDPSKIEVLTLSNNNLGISNFTSFTNLEELRVGNCGINSIDLSGNLNLKHLTCFQNGLTSIDLSNNVLLEVLYASINNLSSLDITNNPLLETVNAGGSLVAPVTISSIDLSNNPELVSINLGNAALTGIDVSTNSKLERLTITNNQINLLDVSNNPTLNYLSAAGNSISSIDLSLNSNLLGIDLGNNMLGSISVGHLTSLVSLSVNNNSLTDLDVSSNLVLTHLRTTSNADLTCIQVNSTQLGAIPQYWQKDDGQTYSLDCSTPPPIIEAQTPEEVVLSSGDIDVNLTLYPNPSDDILYLESPNLKGSAIHIYDLNGKEVYTLDYSETNEQTIDTSKIPSGIYLLKVESKDLLTEKKIVIKH